MRKVDGSVAALAEWVGKRDFIVGDSFGLADIAAGTVCGYLDVRFLEYPWRTRHPTLAHYSDALERRPSFVGSVPVPQVISDKVV